MSIRLSQLRRPLALLLAICLTLSLVVTGFSVPVSAADEIDGGDEATNYLEVPIYDAATLKTVMEDSSYDGENYSDYDAVKLVLKNNIIMTSADGVTKWSYSFVIDGNDGTTDENGNPGKYTLEADASSDFSFKMFAPSSTASNNTTLTIENTTVDVNGQYFLFCDSRNYLGDSTVNLYNVHLKNMRSTGNTTSNAAICLEGNNANFALTAVNFKNVTTESCSGQLMNYKNVKNVTIDGCKLHTSTDTNGNGYGYVIYGVAASNASVGQTLTVTGSTISWDEGAVTTAGISGAGYNTVILDGDTTIGGPATENVPAVQGSASTAALVLGDCTVQNADGSSATVGLRDAKTTLQITGKVQGEPVISLTNDAFIQLTTALQAPLKYEFTASIANKDQLVAKGTGSEGDDDYYPLSETDLAQLIYNEEDSIRTLKINEEDGCAYLYRVDMADCDVALDTTNAVGTNADDNGPIFSRNENDGDLKPAVTITLDGKVLSDNNYTVEYSGTIKVPEGAVPSEKEYDYSAAATVSPAGDLKGGSQEFPYYIKVNTTYELTPDNTETVLTYENGTYSTAVTYYGQDDPTGKALVEDEDYTVVYRIDGDSYTVTATITGAGDYIGSYEVTFDLPGKRTVMNEDELNQALEQHVSYIEFGYYIPVDDPVVVDYDVVLDGQGYELYADGLTAASGVADSEAILTVSAGNVVLTDLTVDGKDQARLISVGSEADVTVTGGSILQNGGAVGQNTPSYLAAYISTGGVLTLEDCKLQDVTSGTYAIGNEGTLNIREGAYLHKLAGRTASIVNGFSDTDAVLNWTGGSFYTDVDDGYAYGSHSLTTSATGAGTVIENRGVFNMSGGELNGFLLDESTGEPTEERTSIAAGAVHVTLTGEFNLSGDAIITGFQQSGSYGVEGSSPDGGGGVYNNGVFNMSGGIITNNIAEGGESTDTGGGTSGDTRSYTCAGGGVYNAGIFNMTGGEISDNTSDVGGGVYSDCARDFSKEHSGSALVTYDASEFYMSGGIVYNNHLTGDVIENTGRNVNGMGPMMGEDSGRVTAIGSELYVSGGSTVEISGGTVSGDTESKVVLNGDEDNTEDAMTIPVGIAVAPAQANTVSQTQYTISVEENASMTISGGADIDINTGVVLMNETSWSQTGFLENKEEVQNDPDTEYVITDLTEPTVTTDATAWLDLDGTLAAALKINTIDVENTTIRLTNVSGGTASNIREQVDGGSSININSDGDLVAVYKDRVTPDENDAQWLQAGASIFLKHETRTYEAEATIYDEDGNETTEMVETTLDADVWEICTHAARIEVDEKEASCSETGNIQYWYCPNCLKLFLDADATEEVTEEEVTIPKTAHTVVWTDEVPATCEEDGYTEGYICEVCGAFIGFDEETEEPAEDRIIPANGHSWIIVDEEPATATENGHTAYVTCEVCGENFIEPEVIPAGETSPTDKTALNVAIETAEGLTEANYTPDSWTKLQDALAAAKDVADDADALQDDVNTALTDLMKAIGELEFASTADKTALSSVISQIEEMNPDDYELQSWENLMLVQQSAQKVLEDPDADQDEVNASVEALIKAIADLEKVDGSQSDEVDKTALNVAIKAAEMYTDSSAYTPESWNKLQEALNYAKTIADEDYSATKDEVETARSNLMTAIEELVKASETDKTSLSIAITAAAALDESNYTPETWAVLKAALDDAGNVLADPTADSTAVENAVNAVMAAIDGLEKVSSEEETDTSALEALVDATAAMTEKMNSSDYTTDSWNALQDALTNAKNVADSSDSTPADVAAAMEALTAALNGLKSAEESGTPEPPDETKDGFVQENGEWHYYDNGTRFTGTDIKEDTKKVVDGTDGWFYIENGKINFSCNSVEQNAYGWWYVLNGKVDFSYTGVANYSNAYGWWYISGGKVDFSKTGIEPNNYGWWRVVNGQVDFSCNSVEQNDYGWWYLVGGKVQFDYTGVANYANANGWWYVSGGKVDFSKTSIEQNNYGWWRVVGGKVDFSCNSVEQNDYGWWYVVGGKVDFSYTGVANYANAYGWWYISGGKVDFSYTGRASNNYGTWNVVNGKVVF